MLEEKKYSKDGVVTEEYIENTFNKEILKEIAYIRDNPPNRRILLQGVQIESYKAQIIRIFQGANQTALETQSDCDKTSVSDSMAAVVAGAGIGGGVAGFAAYGAYKYYGLIKEEKRLWKTAFGEIAKQSGRGDDYIRNHENYRNLIYWSVSLRKCIKKFNNIIQNIEGSKNDVNQYIDFCIRILDSTLCYKESEDDFLTHLEHLKSIDIKQYNEYKETLEIGIKLRYMFLQLFGKCTLHFPEDIETKEAPITGTMFAPQSYQCKLTENDSSALKAASALFVSLVISAKKDLEKKKEVLTNDVHEVNGLVNSSFNKADFLESSNQKKSQEVFGSTSDSILNKILERVKEDFPKEKIYQLYNEGIQQNDEAKLKQAKDMFANVLGRFLAEASYIFGGSDAERIEPFLKEYKIEGLDPEEILNVLCNSQVGIMKNLRLVIRNERCPLPKYTIAKLIQSFDPNFIVPQISLPSGYQYKNQKAISNYAAKENEKVEKQTLKTKSFFQAKKNKKTISIISIAIGISVACGGIVYALNFGDKIDDKKVVVFVAVAAFFIGAGIYIGGLFQPSRPKLVYIGRKFTLDQDYLAARVNRIVDGSGFMEHHDTETQYEDLHRIFHDGLKAILDGTEPRLCEKFPKKEDRDLYVEVARSYVRAWYNMIEEFPDVFDSIMEEKKDRDKELYLLMVITSSGTCEGEGKVFLDTDPQPWGDGRKPDNWREGDGIVKEEDRPPTWLSSASFQKCKCSEPKVKK